MEKTLKVTESSELYRKIDELPLSATDRFDAKHALATADRVVNLITGALSLVGISPDGFKPAPKLKHQ